MTSRTARKDLVTVVIPAYNKAAYLADAVESVLEQNYPEIELLVFDDGSTDDTRRVLQEWGDRFYWESHPNMGQAATLNKGWAMSKGQILGYLSADDVLKSKCVRAAVETMAARSDVVCTYCDFDLIDSSSRSMRTVRAPDFDYREMVLELVCAPGPGVFFRRTAFEQAGGWDPSLRQMPDLDFWLRLGLVGPFQRIPQVLAAFRVHEGSLTFSSAPQQRADEPVRILERYFSREGIPEHIRQDQPRALSNAMLFSAQLHLRSGRYGTALERVRRAAALFPSNLLRWGFIRRIVNALFNRLGYRLYWLFKMPRVAKKP